jgi:hypothetical protein
VKPEELLHRIKEKKNILPHVIKRIKANWMGHNSHTNCHTKRVIEGKIEGRL